MARAKSQSDGDVVVTAAVPSKQEAQDYFGFPVYDRGIQPVWLKVENKGTARIRYTPTGTDREYFSPLEVSYMHRKGYSKEARDEMDRRLHGLAMPRIIPPGETRSGFVFTHASPGTKAFNVDLFGQGQHDQTFAFFLEVPGFVPDHSDVSFNALYLDSEREELDVEGLRNKISEFFCCTRDVMGRESGLPVTVALIGEGEDVLRALLRAEWYETELGRDVIDPENGYFLFGRKADAVFRIQRFGGADRNEMSVWLSPWTFESKPVWLAQITHFLGKRNPFEQFLTGDRLDPAMDEGRNYLLQNLWYSQGLQALAWVNTGSAVSIDEPATDFNGAQYFTDGFRAVLLVSGEPVSLIETRHYDWDKAPTRQGAE